MQLETRNAILDCLYVAKQGLARYDCFIHDFNFFTQNSLMYFIESLQQLFFIQCILLASAVGDLHPFPDGLKDLVPDFTPTIDHLPEQIHLTLGNVTSILYSLNNNK